MVSLTSESHNQLTSSDSNIQLTSVITTNDSKFRVASTPIPQNLILDSDTALVTSARELTPAQTYGIDFGNQNFLPALTKTLDNFKVPELEIATMDLRPAFHPNLSSALGGSLYSSNLIEDFFASLRLRNNPELINFNKNFIQDYFVKFNSYAQAPKYSFVVRDYVAPKTTQSKATTSGNAKPLLNARQKLIPTEWFGVLFINQEHQASSTYQLPANLYFNEQGKLLLKANSAVELGLVDLFGVTNPNRYTVILHNNSNRDEPALTSLETFMDLLLVYGEQRNQDFEKLNQQASDVQQSQEDSYHNDKSQGNHGAVNSTGTTTNGKDDNVESDELKVLNQQITSPEYQVTVPTSQVTIDSSKITAGSISIQGKNVTISGSQLNATNNLSLRAEHSLALTDTTLVASKLLRQAKQLHESGVKWLQRQTSKTTPFKSVEVNFYYPTGVYFPTFVHQVLTYQASFKNLRPLIPLAVADYVLNYQAVTMPESLANTAHKLANYIDMVNASTELEKETQPVYTSKQQYSQAVKNSTTKYNYIRENFDDYVGYEEYLLGQLKRNFNELSQQQPDNSH